MTTQDSSPTTASSGQVDRCVTVCAGHRCGALLSGPAGEGLPALRAAVGDSRGAVLVSTGCLGGCAAGPLMAVSSTRTAVSTTGRTIGAGRPGWLQATSTCWLGPMDAALIRSLARWLRTGGPDRSPLPGDLTHVQLHPHGSPT